MNTESVSGRLDRMASACCWSGNLPIAGVRPVGSMAAAALLAGGRAVAWNGERDTSAPLLRRL